MASEAVLAAYELGFDNIALQIFRQRASSTTRKPQDFRARLRPAEGRGRPLCRGHRRRQLHRRSGLPRDDLDSRPTFPSAPTRSDVYLFSGGTLIARAERQHQGQQDRLRAVHVRASAHSQAFALRPRLRRPGALHRLARRRHLPPGLTCGWRCRGWHRGRAACAAVDASAATKYSLSSRARCSTKWCTADAGPRS